MNWELIYAGVIVFGASLVRGYTGFGFALISAQLLVLIFPPSSVTPVILCLDIAASLILLYRVREDVDWKGLKYLCIGAVFTLPLGTFLLAVIPANTMRVFISSLVICLCFFMLRKPLNLSSGSRMLGMGTGAVSGLLTGSAALGGPPVILFYFSSPRSVSVSRASMIVFFLTIDTLALISTLFFGLADKGTFHLVVLLTLPLMMGTWMGNLAFLRMRNEDVFRRQVIYLLLITALGSLFKFILFPG